MGKLVADTVTVLASPVHTAVTLVLSPVKSGAALVVKDELLALAAVVQLLVAVKAIAVVFTTLELPAVLNALVVKLPVPGLPAVNDIVAVVELTVFVPLTLYVTV